MMVNNSRDLLVFVSVFVCGICVGIVFDFFRAFRKVLGASSISLPLQDALFCAIAFFLFLNTVSTYADGELRWFVFAGFILGVLLYFFTIGKFVLNLFVKIFDLIKKVCVCISKPFISLFVKSEKLFLSIVVKVKKILKLCKNELQKKSKKSLQD